MKSLLVCGIINPVKVSVPFLYSRKISESLWFSNIFRGNIDLNICNINQIFRSSHQSVVWKRVLKISQNSQGNTCAGVSFLIKLQASANSIT